jgi:hypothetical protein
MTGRRFTALARPTQPPPRLTRTGCVVRQPNPRAKPASNRRSQPQQTMAIPLSYDLFLRIRKINV